MPIIYSSCQRTPSAAQVATAPKNEAEPSAAELLAADVPALLRATARQLKEKSAKTRAGAFTVLRELLLALPSAVSGHVPLSLPGVLAALNVRSPLLLP